MQLSEKPMEEQETPLSGGSKNEYAFSQRMYTVK